MNTYINKIKKLANLPSKIVNSVSEISSNIYVKATKNGLLEPPYHQVVHRPKDANGIEFNKLIKNGESPKYPMYNWCINFYHKFKL